MDESDAKDFLEHLQEANETDLSEIELTGCVSSGRDLKNNHVIVMVPSLGFRNSEKPEQIFRKMLLLFIRKANEMVGDSYSIVYAHTSIDIINQYPLIYKFYSILPRAYKKNLQKMYIIHPNYGIKMFFEFARVFLSHKFYSKLCLLDSILEFQRIIPPTVMQLPLKFLKKEDEDKLLKYLGKMVSLKNAFDHTTGTTKILEICSSYIRQHGGLYQCGIFRIPGDEGELSLAKIRLQYSDVSEPNIMMSENKDYILIGDVSALQVDKISVHQGSIDVKSTGENKKQSAMEQSRCADKIEPSVAVIKNINTVAQIFKLSIRDLPEPLIPDYFYQLLMDVTGGAEQKCFNNDWEEGIVSVLSMLPHENISTLAYVVSFLREISCENEINNMDSNNIAIVFAPTIFRPDISDPNKAIRDIRLSQIFIKELVDRKSIMYNALKVFKLNQANGLSTIEQKLVCENPIMSAFTMQSMRPDVSIPLDADNFKADDGSFDQKLNVLSLDDISHNLSPSMVGRMGRAGGRETVNINK